ncbi:MAG: hypothetical protein JSS95_11895 [Acidobacteria bacterium]|nr:hypothetical protein [Acidobacteriota bacterium]
MDTSNHKSASIKHKESANFGKYVPVVITSNQDIWKCIQENFKGNSKTEANAIVNRTLQIKFHDTFVSTENKEFAFGWDTQIKQKNNQNLDTLTKKLAATFIYFLIKVHPQNHFLNQLISETQRFNLEQFMKETYTERIFTQCAKPTNLNDKTTKNPSAIPKELMELAYNEHSSQALGFGKDEGTFDFLAHRTYDNLSFDFIDFITNKLHFSKLAYREQAERCHTIRIALFQTSNNV